MKDNYMRGIIALAILIAVLCIPKICHAEEYQDTYLPEDIIQICQTAEEVYNIDDCLLMALCETESSGNLEAVNKYGDCIGLCQLNPKYMKEFAKKVIGNDPTDWLDPEIQIFTCCEYLNYLKDLPGTEGDIMLVLESYNKGPENVEGCGKYSKTITERAYEITLARDAKK